MLKYIWLCAACLLGGSLTAETVGNVEFQFPPSRYEWKVLVDNTFFENPAFFNDEDDEDDLDITVPDNYTWGTPWNADDEDDDDYPLEFAMPKFKFFTHREGDALEIFLALQISADFDEEDEENETLEHLQKNLDETINLYLPNHRFILHAISETDDQAFGDWELNDGQIDVMHGYTRALKVKDTDGDDTITVLGYLTTAVRNENNRALWTNALNQVRILK